MTWATGERVEVAEAILGGVAIEFKSDGTATMTACQVAECDRCGCYRELEGDPVALTPDQAWHLLQVVRQRLSAEAYRRAAQAVIAAIEG